MLPSLRRNTVKLGCLLSIAEQIQAFSLARKTGEIYVTNVPPPARINLVDGELVDAQFGQRSGLEAAIGLINLPDPHSEFIVGEKPHRRTINLPYVQILCEAARSKDESDNKIEISGATQLLHLNPTSPHLRFTLGTEIRTFTLRPGLTLLGRSAVNEIIIGEASVSQRHASLDYSRLGVMLKDLGSTNGTYVAGQMVKERWLGAQESLQFGSVHCSFIGGIASSIELAENAAKA